MAGEPLWDPAEDAEKNGEDAEADVLTGAPVAV
jgi:hypothetical protein